ncbi:MAG: TRAP transporter substrate-binding protein [Burkholderiales bacterium]|nr:TRAP transporter substrate-binding protein [Burkholderiales bacterium]
MKMHLLSAALAASALAAPMPCSAQTVLKLNSPAPPPSYLHGKAFTPWAKDVSEASGGALQVQTFYGGTLGNFAVTYDRVVDGVADIGFTLTALAGGKFKLQDVAALPFEARSASVASEALWNLYEKGITASEFDAVRPLAIWTFPNSAIHSKDLINSLASFKGKKVAASNLIAGRIVVALGGAPVTLRPDETYQAVSRGTAEAALMPFTGMLTFKIHEVTKHHVDVPLGSDAALLFINRKKYDSLPAQAKAAIDRFSNLRMSRHLGSITDAVWSENRAVVKAGIVDLAAAEEERWRKAVAPIADGWAKETPGGQKVLAAFRAEVKALSNRK